MFSCLLNSLLKQVINIHHVHGEMKQYCTDFNVGTQNSKFKTNPFRNQHVENVQANITMLLTIQNTNYLQPCIVNRHTSCTTHSHTCTHQPCLVNLMQSALAINMLQQTFVDSRSKNEQYYIRIKRE